MTYSPITSPSHNACAHTERDADGADARPASDMKDRQAEGCIVAAILEMRQTPSPHKREPDSAMTARLVKNVAESTAHDMGTLLSIMGFDLDALAAERLSIQATRAVRSLRSEIECLGAIARELQMAAAESQARQTDVRTRLAAWWPDVQALLHAVHRENVIIRAAIPWGLPPLCIGPQNLTRVVLNLVANAAHSIQDRASGRTRPIKPTERRPRGRIDIAARLAENGRAVSLSVADNGAGMSPAILAQARNPHFTTRADRGGSGLGLSIVQRLVGDAGGSVRLSSTFGAGTTVVIELPVPVHNEIAPSLNGRRNARASPRPRSG